MSVPLTHLADDKNGTGKISHFYMIGRTLVYPGDDEYYHTSHVSDMHITCWVFFFYISRCYLISSYNYQNSLTILHVATVREIPLKTNCQFILRWHVSRHRKREIVFGGGGGGGSVEWKIYKRDLNEVNAWRIKCAAIQYTWQMLSRLESRWWCQWSRLGIDDGWSKPIWPQPGHELAGREPVKASRGMGRIADSS